MFYRLCLLVLFFSFLTSTVVLADESISEKEPSQEEVIQIKKLRALETEKQKVSFFYLMGGGGYTCYNSILDYNCLNMKNRDYVDGFAINLLGGWQVNKYFAMEAGIDYIQAEYRSLNFKYTVLAQPYIEINKSWSIMPKIGVGFLILGVLSQVIEQEYSTQPVGFDVYGVIGLRANYKKFMFGLSYEQNLYGQTNTFMVVTEVGVKF